jgi:hypothetical protein
MKLYQLKAQYKHEATFYVSGGVAKRLIFKIIDDQ